MWMHIWNWKERSLGAGFRSSEYLTSIFGNINMFPRDQEMVLACIFFFAFKLGSVLRGEVEVYRFAAHLCCRPVKNSAVYIDL